MPARRTLIAAVALAAFAAPAAATAQVPDLTVPAARDAEPVVLTGRDLGTWAVPNEQTARLPLMDLAQCSDRTSPSCPNGGHSHYAEPQATTAGVTPSGLPASRFLGYRWTGSRFEQIPFQVDEVFTRYLNNSASGFSPYSGEDRHTTYAYDGPGDREGFRYTADGPPGDACRARAASPAASDPVPGLDFDDELAFMASDAGPKAPASAPLPAGVLDAREVRLADPSDPAARARFVYVMRAGDHGPAPAFDASNGYVRYQRDPDADRFMFSESSYDSYGNAPKGVHCDADGNVVRNPDGTPKIAQRRPLDTATVTTSRYRFRYDGRWLMTRIEVAQPGGGYGPDLVDRWKARAFAQDPGSETPCCGFEEEDTNWGGSSILLGERVGPVRAVRETWGADSGTNVVRRETFYREQTVQRTWLRVHAVPPLDGIYAQWDFNAGKVDRFFSPRRPGGVPIDGVNDEAFGNLDDPCNPHYDGNSTSDLDQGYRTLYRQLALCDAVEYHQSVDAADPTHSAVNAGFDWTVTAGPHGSIVDRLSVDAEQVSPGGLAQSLLAVPYYRDDSCFDDGTGSDPGPKVKLRSGDEPRQTADGTLRRCWRPSDGDPQGSERFFQGSIGTHGMHVLAIADSDNARLTVPVTEIVSDWTMVMLPGRRDAADGERYGRAFEKPLVAAVRPVDLPTVIGPRVSVDPNGPKVRGSVGVGVPLGAYGSR